MISVDCAMELHVDWLKDLDVQSVGLPQILQVAQQRGDDTAAEAISKSIQSVEVLQHALRTNVNHIGYWLSVDNTKNERILR